MGWVRSNLNEIRRMKAKFGGGALTIELANGSRARFERDAMFEPLFMHFMSVLRALHAGEPRPEPPPLLRAIAAAKDREKAFLAAFPDGAPFMPWSEEPLVARGEFVPRPLSEAELEDAG